MARFEFSIILEHEDRKAIATLKADTLRACQLNDVKSQILPTIGVLQDFKVNNANIEPEQRTGDRADRAVASWEQIEVFRFLLLQQ